MANSGEDAVEMLPLQSNTWTPELLASALLSEPAGQALARGR